MLTGQGGWARSRRFYCFQAMSEEQLKAVETEASAQLEEKDGEAVVEKISEEDLEGVAGGISFIGGASAFAQKLPYIE